MQLQPELVNKLKWFTLLTFIIVFIYTDSVVASVLSSLLGLFIFFIIFYQEGKLILNLLNRLKRIKTSEDKKRPLDVILGYTHGKPVVINLTRMKHTVVFAQTGLGKTTAFYKILYELFRTTDPANMQVVLITPKSHSFRVFSNMPHLKWKIATLETAVHTLQAVDTEITRRENLLNSLPHDRIVEDLNDYHRIIEELHLPLEHLPILKVCIDEIHRVIDLSPAAKKYIMRIVKEARSTGIHLLGATQRPTAPNLPHETQSQIPTKLIGYMDSAKEYSYANVPPETYKQMINTPGYFMIRYMGEWSFVQVEYITNSRIEAFCKTVAKATPEDLPKIQERLSKERIPFEGSNIIKEQLLRAWYSSYNMTEKPKAKDFVAYFKVQSMSTANKWINKTWNSWYSSQLE